jgi:hypothetical protein
MIFARDLTGPLTSLVKQIDKATAKNSGCSMGSFIVFLNDDEKLEKTLKEFSDKENLKHTIITLMTDPVGPKPYKIAKDADVTVVLYTDRTVKANYAFPKGKMTDSDVSKIVEDVSKIVPKDEKK